jgi:6-phosphofructokinase 1
MRLGVLTGGGDCPGLNAIIRAVVRGGAARHDHSFVGFRDGWRGVLEDEAIDLDLATTTGILHRGGTILGSSGANPYGAEDGPRSVAATMDRRGLDGLIVIGGEGTLGAAVRLHEEADVPLVGVPKTIDNDVGGTDVTVGFQTAVQVATDAIDRLHTTAESHDRVMIVEVMGRRAGWIAVTAGLAGGADAILLPERPFDLDETCARLRRRHERRRFSIVVVAEGATPVPDTLEVPTSPLDENGFPRLGGIANVVAPVVEELTGFQTRVTILGYLQRGGTPVAFDRVLGTRLGLAATDLATAGGWGRMVGVRGDRIEDAPIRAALDYKAVPQDRYDESEVFFG